MAAVDDVVELIAQFHLAQAEFVKINPAPGWEQVAAAIERAASQFRDGDRYLLEWSSGRKIGEHMHAERPIEKREATHDGP
jgi:hypothetical protein